MVLPDYFSMASDDEDETEGREIETVTEEADVTECVHSHAASGRCLWVLFPVLIS